MTEQDSMATGPDCREGKHRVCDGRGFDLVADEIIDCACPRHEIIDCACPRHEVRE